MGDEIDRLLLREPWRCLFCGKEEEGFAALLFHSLNLHPVQYILLKRLQGQQASGVGGERDSGTALECGVGASGSAVASGSKERVLHPQDSCSVRVEKPSSSQSVSKVARLAHPFSSTSSHFTTSNLLSALPNTSSVTASHSAPDSKKGSSSSILHPPPFLYPTAHMTAPQQPFSFPTPLLFSNLIDRATALKRKAGACEDAVQRQILYLEAVAYYLMAAEAKVQEGNKFPTSFDTGVESFLRKVTDRFTKCRDQDNRILALSRQTQAILSYRLYVAQRDNIDDNEGIVKHFLDSCEESREAKGLWLPKELETPIRSQLRNLQYLHKAHEYWDQASLNISASASNTAFFAHLENLTGALRLTESDYPQLCVHLMTGVLWLKDILPSSV